MFAAYTNHHPNNTAMGIAERKAREREEMRELILDAATRVFIEEGYDKTSIRNIADRIEYSPATIYLYFADKDALLFAIHERGFALLLKAFEPVRQIANPLDKLEELGRIYVSWGMANPEFYDLMFIARAPVSVMEAKSGWDCGMQTFAFLHDVCKECLATGHFPASMTSIDLAMMTWTGVHGIVSLFVRKRFSGMSQQMQHYIIADCCPPLPVPTDGSVELPDISMRTYNAFIASIRR